MTKNSETGGKKAQSKSKSPEEKQNNKNSFKEVSRTPVKGTPFYIIEVDGEYIIAMGMTRMSEKTFKSEEEAIKEIKKKPWDMITAMAITITRQVNEYEQSKNK